MFLDYWDDFDFVVLSYSDYVYFVSIGCWFFVVSILIFSWVFLIVNWYLVFFMNGERERKRLWNLSVFLLIGYNEMIFIYIFWFSNF